jgi:hypothetical protein
MMKKMRTTSGWYAMMLGLGAAGLVWSAGLGLAQETKALAGHYYLQGVHEVGSELLLHPDGRFEYFLAYGAYDESATGTWKVQDGRVLLNTAGTATPPSFRLKQRASRPERPLTIEVHDQNGRGLAAIDLVIDYGDNHQETGYTQSYGWQAVRPRRLPKAIGLGLKMYNLEPQWFKVTGSDNYYVFEFNPGDLGRAKFRDTPLTPENGDLVMEREGRKLRYVKGGER